MGYFSRVIFSTVGGGQGRWALVVSLYNAIGCKLLMAAAILGMYWHWQCISQRNWSAVGFWYAHSLSLLFTHDMHAFIHSFISTVYVYDNVYVTIK